MDDIKTLLQKYFRYRPTFKSQVVPPKPKPPPLGNDDGPYIGEEAFVIGLGENSNENCN